MSSQLRRCSRGQRIVTTPSSDGIYHPHSDSVQWRRYWVQHCCRQLVRLLTRWRPERQSARMLKITNDGLTRQEISQREVRAYTRSTSRSLAGEQNKSAVTDHAISLNHVIDWDQAKVIDREGNRVDRWINEAIHIRKEQDKSIIWDEGSYQLSHIYNILFAPKLSCKGRLDRPFRRRLQSKPKHQQ